LKDSEVSEIDLAIDDGLQLGRQLDGTMGFFGPIAGPQAVRAWFTLIAALYKNSAYFAEREWRILLNKPHKPMPGQRFRAGKSTVIPYVEAELNRGLDFEQSDDYMIRKVFVGPTPNPELSVESLQSLFLSKGQTNVVVEKSAIPFRYW
jgi:hypothetical protein